MSTFLESVEQNLKGVEHFSVGLCPGCATCRDDYGFDTQEAFDHAIGAICNEGSFSWSSCDSCGSSLGGDRYDAHGFVDNQLNHFSVCSDCLFYYANGDVPDQWEE